MTTQNLIEMIRDMVAACRLIDEFNKETFPSGKPLCIDGKPINHSTLNQATMKASAALRRMGDDYDR